MDLKVEAQIPFLDFTKDPQDLEEKSDGWKYLCHKVREACEGYGYFQVAYDKVPSHLREEMFMALKDLFNLPDDTKKKHSSSKPYYGYTGNSDLATPCERFIIEDAPTLDSARALTDLMWPEGNPGICQILNSMTRKMLELEIIIQKMIFESFGVEKFYESDVANSQITLAMMKYKAPPSNESALALDPHTDKGILTILCSDVQGLELLSKQGDWFRVMPSEGTFTVFVGDSLKAWSNGRLRSAEHRVMMSGDREKYSFALGVLPKAEAVVEVAEELVDKEHPLLFRPFKFLDFVLYSFSNRNGNLEIYAGV